MTAPTPMTDAEIAALAELEKKATPTPWSVGKPRKPFVGSLGREVNISAPTHHALATVVYQMADDDLLGVPSPTQEASAAFIAAARNAVPRLIATIAARDAEIAELRDALSEARDALNGGMNTIGLHHQIDAALKEPRHD